MIIPDSNSNELFTVFCVYSEYKVLVTLEELQRKVFDHIGIQWKDLANSLGWTRTDIQTIKQDGNGYLKDEIDQFFVVWKQRKGNEATAANLISDIDKCESCKFILDCLVEGEVITRLSELIFILLSCMYTMVIVVSQLCMLFLTHKN